MYSGKWNIYKVAGSLGTGLEAVTFLEETLGCEVDVIKADDPRGLLYTSNWNWFALVVESEDGHCGIACRFDEPNTEARFINCARHLAGDVVVPVRFTTDMMIQVADACMNTPNNMVDTQIVYLSEKRDADPSKRLASITIDITAENMKHLWGQRGVTNNRQRELRKGVFRNAVLPYIGSKTGLVFSELPLRYILLRNVIRITPRWIETYEYHDPLPVRVLLGAIEEVDRE